MNPSTTERAINSSELIRASISGARKRVPIGAALLCIFADSGYETRSQTSIPIDQIWAQARFQSIDESHHPALRVQTRRENSEGSDAAELGRPARERHRLKHCNDRSSPRALCHRG